MQARIRSRLLYHQLQPGVQLPKNAATVDLPKYYITSCFIGFQLSYMHCFIMGPDKNFAKCFTMCPTQAFAKEKSQSPKVYLQELSK